MDRLRLRTGYGWREVTLQPGKQAGVEMAQEILIYAHDKYAGVYLMPSFGRYEMCASVLDVLPRFQAVGA